MEWKSMEFCGDGSYELLHNSVRSSDVPVKHLLKGLHPALWDGIDERDTDAPTFVAHQRIGHADKTLRRQQKAPA